jgi:hypothetical protein
MMDDQMHTHIDYQVMRQPVAQDVTVTFADGTSFTARYCGSGITARTDPWGDRYDHIQLHLIAPLDATITATVQTCGHIADGDELFPCILIAGHTAQLTEDEYTHIDIHGEMW